MKTEIQYRDRLILYILAAFGLARIWDITILAGFNNYKYVSQKLKFLHNLKLIESDYLNREKVFFLTARGYREIGKDNPAYKFNFSSLHDADVTRIVSWLYLTEGISYADVLSDRQMKFLLKGKNIHRADIVLGKIAYEYEKSPKQNSKLKNNIVENKKYEKQVWIVPDEKAFIANRIKKISKEVLAKNVEIKFLSEINEVVLNADLSKNKMRDKAVRGERDTDIIFQKTNKIVGKYL